MHLCSLYVTSFRSGSSPLYLDYRSINPSKIRVSEDFPITVTSFFWLRIFLRFLEYVSVKDVGTSYRQQAYV